MIKKLVVFAITSGLAAKLYKTWREKNIAAGNIPSKPAPAGARTTAKSV